MTPGSGILLVSRWMAAAGLVFEQAEDEIAALNMRSGLRTRGRGRWWPLRRRVRPDGGGAFAGGMLEAPSLWLWDAPGPATGMPTRTGQEELAFVLSAGTGVSPPGPFPGSVEEAYAMAHTRWRCRRRTRSVLILTDQYLADTVVDADPGIFRRTP